MYAGKNGFNSEADYFEELPDEMDHDDLRIVTKDLLVDQEGNVTHMVYHVMMIDEVESKKNEPVWKEYVQVVKLLKITHIPKVIRPKESLLAVHDGFTQALYSQNIQMIHLIANIIRPQVGFLFCYGVRVMFEVLPDKEYEEALNDAFMLAMTKADEDFFALKSLLQGNYRQCQFKMLNNEESEALREKMLNASHFQVIRGVPRTYNSFGTSAEKDPILQKQEIVDFEQNEELIRGLLKNEYLWMVMATPIPLEEIQRWSYNIAREYSQRKSQINGAMSYSANVGLPIAAVGNISAMTGNTMTMTESDSENLGFARSLGSSHQNSTQVGQADSLQHNHSNGINHQENVGVNQGLSRGTSDNESYGNSVQNGHTVSHQESVSTGQSQSLTNTHGTSSNMSYSNGQNTGMSENFTDGIGRTLSNSTGTSDSVSNGTSTGYSSTDGTGTSHSTMNGQAHSDGQSFQESRSMNQNRGMGTSQSSGSQWSNSHGGAYGVNNNAGVNASLLGFGGNYGEGENYANSHSSSAGGSSSSSVSQNQSVGSGQSIGHGTSQSDTTSQAESNGQSSNHTDGRSHGTSTSNSHGVNQSSSDAVSRQQSHGTGVNRGYSNSSSNGTGISDSQSVGQSQSTSHTLGVGDAYSKTLGQSHSLGHGKNFGETAGKSFGVGNGTSEQVGSGQGRTNSVGAGSADGTQSSQTESTGTAKQRGSAEGLSSSVGMANGTTYTLAPAIGLSKSMQTYDAAQENISQILAEHNRRFHIAKKTGMFIVDVYAMCEDSHTKRAIASLTSSSFNGDTGVGGVQIVAPDIVTSEHLLKHASVFVPCTMTEVIKNTCESYLFASTLLSSELAAYTHLPQVETGGFFSIAENIPAFVVTGERSKGAIQIGKQINHETGEAFLPYTLEKNENRHIGIFGFTGTGKTSTAERYVEQICRKCPEKKIVALDFKSSWRKIMRWVPKEDFAHYSLYPSGVNEIRTNLYVPPRYVPVMTWMNHIHESLCIAFGFGDKQYGELRKAALEEFEKAGVIVYDNTNIPHETENARELVCNVTLDSVCVNLLNKQKSVGEDKTKGNSARDMYASFEAKLTVFHNTKLKALYCETDPDKIITIEQLLEGPRALVLEGGDMDNVIKEFVIQVLSQGMFAYNQKVAAREGRVQQRLFIIEEAHRVIRNTEKMDTPFKVVEDIYAVIFNEGREFGMQCMVIAQSPSEMPKNIVGNCNITFVHCMGDAEVDAKMMTEYLAKDPRIHHTDVKLWLTKQEIGVCAVRIKNQMMHQLSEPNLIKVDRISAERPSDKELIRHVGSEIPDFIGRDEFQTSFKNIWQEKLQNIAASAAEEFIKSPA